MRYAYGEKPFTLLRVIVGSWPMILQLVTLVFIQNYHFAITFASGLFDSSLNTTHLPSIQFTMGIGSSLSLALFLRMDAFVDTVSTQ